MKRYRTYCSACDAEVLVSVDPDTKEIDPDQVECLDEGPECAEADCPLTGLSASELADVLEFVPAPETSGSEGESRDLDQAKQLLGEARIASFRRRFRHRDD